MNKFIIDFVVPADGHNLLYKVEDSAVIEARNADEAIKQIFDHCRAWGYSNPAIINIRLA